MKKLYVCAIVVKLLMLTSIEANAFTTAPFEEPGGGTTFFTPADTGSDFGFDNGTFFEPDRSGSLQRQTAFGQITSFFQTLIRRGFIEDCTDGGGGTNTATLEQWGTCCDMDTAPGSGISRWGNPDFNCHILYQGPPVDAPVGNGLLFLLAIAGLHFLILYFRRRAIA